VVSVTPPSGASVTPTPVSGSTTPAAFVAASYYLSGTPSQYTEALYQYVLFAAADTNGNAQFYSLNLTPTQADQLAATQIGTFGATIPSGGTAASILCDTEQAQGSLSQPQSLFALVEILASGSSCSAAGATYSFYYVNASTGIVAQVTGITQPKLFPIYSSSGTLTGLANFNASTNTLNLYSYTAGANPFAGTPTAVTGSGGAALSSSNVNSVTYLGSAAGSLGVSQIYLDVTLTSATSTHYVYSLATGSSSATQILQAAGTLGTGGADSINDASYESDGTNVFFVDSSSGSQTLYQIGAMGTLTALYTNDSPSTTPLSLIASDGTHVLVTLETPGSTNTWTFYPLLAGRPNQPLPGSTGDIASSGDFPPSTFSGLATPGNTTSKQVFVNWIGAVGGTTEQWCAIMTPSGSVLFSTSPSYDGGSDYSQYGNSQLLTGSVGSSGTVLLAANIQSVQSNFIEGASLYVIQLNSNGSDTVSSSALEPPGGGSFTVPTPVGTALPGWPPMGVLWFASGANSGTAYTYDMNTNQIFGLTETNTTFAPW
jgi:hypothetical protein